MTRFRGDLYLSPIERYTQRLGRPVELDGASGAPDLIPAKDMGTALAWASRKRSCTGYPGAGGPWEVRVAYAEYANKHLQLPGRVDPENIVATAGAQHALHLLARILEPRTRIAVESPGFIEGIMAFQAERHLLYPFNVYIDGRVDPPPDGVEAVYAVPSHHNPTGITYPEEGILELRSLSRSGILVVEDDPYRPLLTSPPESIWTPGARVAYVSTFSKILAPGLRSGFIISPPETASLLELASQHDFSLSTLTACAVVRLIDEGVVESHLSQVRRIYLERMAVLLDELDSRLPSVEKSRPSMGGFYTSLRLPCDAEYVADRMIEMKASLLPAAGFYIGDADKRLARVSIARLRVDSIRDYVNRLSTVLSTCRRGTRRTLRQRKP